MIIGRGPNRPWFPLSLIHPLGPNFRHLPLTFRRHLLYLRTHGRWGNFSSPRRFTEKIQWRILNDRRDLITLACDKLRSKEHVANQWRAAGISDRFKVPATYYTGTNAGELIASLPLIPNRFVMKPNHSSGRHLVVDTSLHPLSSELINELFIEWLDSDEETKVMGHWGYLGSEQTIIVEERVGEDDQAPIDIRIFTNRGEISGAACTGVSVNGTKWSATYNASFVRRPSGFPGQLPLDAITPLSNLTADEMRELRAAIRAVSESFVQVRVDLYRSGGAFYFGEFTAYSSGGLVEYNEETDYRLGALWQLPCATASERSDQR